nr:hypothetical protein [Tanacetum cinerariifolium]
IAATSAILAERPGDIAGGTRTAIRARFRSSYESSPSSSPPNLPSRKRYQGTSELVEDEEEEDEEMEESSNSDSVSEDADGEGPTAEDEDLAAGDDGLAAGNEGLGMRVESHSLGGDEAVPEGKPRAASVVETFVVGQSSGFIPETERPKRVSALRNPTLTTWIDPEDGIAYIDVRAYPPPIPPAQTLPSLEWSSSSLPISPAPSIFLHLFHHP